MMSIDLTSDGSRWCLDWRPLEETPGNHWSRALQVTQLCRIIVECVTGLEQWSGWPVSAFSKGSPTETWWKQFDKREVSIMTFKSRYFAENCRESDWKSPTLTLRISGATGPTELVQVANLSLFQELSNGGSMGAIWQREDTQKALQK